MDSPPEPFDVKDETIFTAILGYVRQFWQILLMEYVGGALSFTGLVRSEIQAELGLGRKRRAYEDQMGGVSLAERDDSSGGLTPSEGVGELSLREDRTT